MAAWDSEKVSGTVLPLTLASQIPGLRRRLHTRSIARRQFARWMPSSTRVFGAHPAAEKSVAARRENMRKTKRRHGWGAGRRSAF